VRRRFAFVLTVVTLSMLTAGCDWAMFRADPNHSGFNPGDKTIGTANVDQLTTRWTANVGPGAIASAAVAQGVAYVGSNGKLVAFDAAGTTDCSGTPKTCAPLWSGILDDNGLVSDIVSSPAVANGVVYVATRDSGPHDLDGRLWAFDAAGVTNCSGAPKSCTPLWSGQIGTSFSSPTVANEVVYVGSDDGNLYAFDAAGSTNCSGSPKSCTPLWTAFAGSGGLSGIESSPAVANGVVYVTSFDGKLYAFDAAGTTNCSGSPKSCAPLWTASASFSSSSPAVVNGVVYVGSGDTRLYAFDAAGTTNCSGSPKSCAPLWSAATGGAVESSPAVANGVVYVGSDDHKLYAFDAAGTTNCSGSPKSCAPLWSAATGGVVFSSPAVANGVVYVGSEDHKLYAFDAAGTTNCSGSPKSCTSLWSATTGDEVIASPAVANGVVYVRSADQKLYAFAP
jgi:outer membrane protein assembly factor BamB